MVKLVEGKTGFSEPAGEPRLRTGTKDAEEIVLRMVLNYEKGEGREAEDRHRQRGIGYDIYSKKADGEEMFIEVKHFSEQEGAFKLRPHQIKKAKKEGDKYYVYVVRDYIRDVKKLTTSLPFVVGELTVLRPVVVLIPKPVWAHPILQAAMRGASPQSQFLPVP
ncbi:MAG TPA: DUF3883 domain-containing protein, partial [Sedimentisphaerales bacterium]|nr:DUF3883 domain-containing protein [Sedimentisphaerales bacterium]